MRLKILLSAILFSLIQYSHALPLQPGFSKSEYKELLKLLVRPVNDGSGTTGTPVYSRIYRSPEMGLKNQWDLWVRPDSVAVLCVRGTTSDITSWLANFYAAMVPATGSLQLENNYRFDYRLADDPKAAVHTGWLVGTGMLVRDMLPKIDSLYKNGTRNFLIMGHSQGGGISYLLTSHLYDLRRSGRLPSDIIFKTYCSAAPKPGNLYYAYEFEAMTSEGWAYNVVNASDWVPEMPVSVQTTGDYNNVNPFVNAVPTIKKQKFLKRIFLMRAYKRLSKPLRRSQEEYMHYLGDKLFHFIHESMPEFQKPKYFESINYVRTGKTIVLKPDEEYKKRFPDDQSHLFIHHLFAPYLYLVENYEVN